MGLVLLVNSVGMANSRAIRPATRILRVRPPVMRREMRKNAPADVTFARIAHSPVSQPRDSL
ncbi:hypothetical protein SCH4B_2978 [Ruegeria sp. TrichCH4B]|nr:hypothetical protein SCH4B_2978 [Ruegeria sp. TrichCH4B]